MDVIMVVSTAALDILLLYSFNHNFSLRVIHSHVQPSRSHLLLKALPSQSPYIFLRSPVPKCNQTSVCTSSLPGSLDRLFQFPRVSLQKLTEKFNTFSSNRCG